MNNIDQIAQFFNDSENFRGSVKRNEVLSSHTTMHVGGRAEIFIEPENSSSLIFAINKLKDENINFFILGGGSNVIIGDRGLKAVISTRKINKIEEIKKGIKVEAGSSWGGVISFCKKNNLSGFESFTGLSGSVGGALYMNATCFGLSACDKLLSLEYFNCQDCQIHTYLKREEDWAYKKSPFQIQGGSSLKVILSAEFALSQGFDSKKSEEAMTFRREKGHFKAPSSGSAFKNDSERGIIAGKLIDECGLKGFTLGGAQIAPWHGNFIINPEQKASSSDIKNLSDQVKKIVLEKKGILLENEIIFVGK
ncbi:MAG: UDP-N-acetylmuramate dehydrogenase [Treponema sp.]|nr:UDP-N-acetylmuramate dehydrogenase [Treponema sp.]